MCQLDIAKPSVQSAKKLHKKKVRWRKLNLRTLEAISFKGITIISQGAMH
jgi:hypothetical protein